MATQINICTIEPEYLRIRPPTFWVSKEGINFIHKLGCQHYSSGHKRAASEAFHLLLQLHKEGVVISIRQAVAISLGMNNRFLWWLVALCNGDLKSSSQSLVLVRREGELVWVLLLNQLLKTVEVFSVSSSATVLDVHCECLLGSCWLHIKVNSIIILSNKR